MLRVKEVAARLGCSLSTAYQLIESGRLPSHQVGMRKGIRVSEDDLRAYLDRCRSQKEPKPAPMSQATSGRFKHLDGERLRAAWRQQGVPFDRTSAGSALSSGS